MSGEAAVGGREALDAQQTEIVERIRVMMDAQQTEVVERVRVMMDAQQTEVVERIRVMMDAQQKIDAAMEAKRFASGVGARARDHFERKRRDRRA